MKLLKIGKVTVEFQRLKYTSPAPFRFFKEKYPVWAAGRQPSRTMIYRFGVITKFVDYQFVIRVEG